MARTSRQCGSIRIGVVDIGANTSRLLVASYRHGRVEAVIETRTPIRLGAEIEERGKVSKAKLRQVVKAVEGAVVAGREAGAPEIYGFVTSLGRQSRNGAELAAAVVSATGISVRLLSADEEGRLAYRGVRDAIDGTVLVGDIGGGSVQIAVGHARAEPLSSFSANVGSLRLTRRHIRHDPPGRRELKAVRESAESALAGIKPTDATHVFVTGGTARALRDLRARPTFRASGSSAPSGLANEGGGDLGSCRSRGACRPGRR